MSWMDKCCETYDNNLHMAGKETEGGLPLIPVCHTITNAQIEIMLSADGDFLQAEAIEKNNSKTIIPVTEKSAGRSGSAIAPHALCDTLAYVAGDFSDYTKEQNKTKNINPVKFEEYTKALGLWANSAYSHPKVRAIYNYCMKKRIINDLIKSGIIECDEDGLSADKKINGTEYAKRIVRWRVLTDAAVPSGTWEDMELIRKYTDYSFSAQTDNNTDICYITGEYGEPAHNHAKNIVLTNANAKLISANDNTNFTFRGRFINSDEAVSVSTITSQKAHNALKWLTANQGVNFGGKIFVCWCPLGKNVPKPNQMSFLHYMKDDEPDDGVNTYPEYQKRLYKLLHGWKEDFSGEECIVIIALDAATTGRLSVTYYNELTANDFFDRIKVWNESCCWYVKRHSPSAKTYLNIEAPSAEKIIHFAFGTQQGAFVKADEKILKEHTQRIMHCIVDKQPVPQDIVTALTRKCSVPLAYTSENREMILSYACALIKKYRNDRNKGETWLMVLDTENTNRSYLFGRLLAVAEMVEKATYTNSETRDTNAIRLQNSFQQHPMHVWRLIEEALNPYYKALNPGLRNYYKNIIGDILEKLENDDYSKLNLALEDVYLLGYYLQRKELYSKKTTQEDK